MTDTSTATVTARAKAEATLAAVRAVYAQEVEAGLYPEPSLVADAYDAPFAVTWEDGPYEWALRTRGGVDEELYVIGIDAGMAPAAARKMATVGAVAVPDGVEVEPYFSFVLSILVDE
jgi:hypothetical protein